EGKEIADADVLNAISNSPPAVSTGALEPTSRAAQLVAVLAWDPNNETQKKRIREVYEEFREREPSRERSWVCFMLARAIGRLQDKEAVPYLVSTLKDEKREFDFGSAPPPNIFLTEAMTPIHRATAANALGEIGDVAALETLLDILQDFENIMDVRDAAAVAVGKIADKAAKRGDEIDPKFIEKFEEITISYPELYTGKTMYDSLKKMKK
ncbi:MAG: HEAT repeat domain-containing protein, partial [Thermoguttaceae bacterium]